MFRLNNDIWILGLIIIVFIWFYCNVLNSQDNEKLYCLNKSVSLWKKIVSQKNEKHLKFENLYVIIKIFGLDEISQKQVIEILKEVSQKKILIIATHKPDLFDFCDQKI